MKEDMKIGVTIEKRQGIGCDEDTVFSPMWRCPTYLVRKGENCVPRVTGLTIF